MSTERPDSCVLFRTDSVLDDAERRPPAVVIGLPRSGSTFLAHVITTLNEWYVFDDLYFVQTADSVRANGPLTPTQVNKLTDFLGWSLKARIRHEDKFLRPDCSWDDADKMVEAVRTLYAARAVEWPELQEEWITRLALHHGRTRWGWKTPQDFHHVRRLQEVYPGVRFIFILRDPARMMASFKFISGRDGKQGQYHPILYSRYWRMAVEAYKRYENDDSVPMLLVRFEELTKEPDAQADRIAGFLGASRSGPVPVKGSNTSFTKGGRRDITPTEQWMLRRMAGPLMDELGYTVPDARFRLRDLPDLALTTLRFVRYQARTLPRHARKRTQVVSFLKAWWRSPDSQQAS